MGTELAAIGLYPKKDKKDKVYYVNRKNYRFPIPSLDEKGKRIQKTNSVTGQPLFNSRGEPEYTEEGIQFERWLTRFTNLGYWSVFVVKKDTPKVIAEKLEQLSASKKSEVMNEEQFVEYTNPTMLEEVKRNVELEKENTALVEKLSKADEEIARLKEKAGINK